MAATSAVFARMTHTQIAIVSEQRQLNGAHCYYKQKYTFKKVPVLIELPGILNKDAVCTIVYEYTLPFRTLYEADRYSFGLSSGKGDPRGTIIEISGAYALRYRYDFSDEDHKSNSLPTPHQGLHVLQYMIVGSSIEVFLDGVQVSDTGAIGNKEKEFRFIFGQSRDEEPFELWEIHFTTPNPTEQFTALGFPHKKFQMRTGSYIQYFGTWIDKPRIKDGNQTLAELDKSGVVLLTLSVYPKHLTLTDGLDTALAKEIPGRNEVNLGDIRCNDPSELRDITIVVGDYGS